MTSIKHSNLIGFVYLGLPTMTMLPHSITIIPRNNHSALPLQPLQLTEDTMIIQLLHQPIFTLKTPMIHHISSPFLSHDGEHTTTDDGGTPMVPQAYTWKSTRGSILLGAMLLTSLVMAVLLRFVVQRAKKCLTDRCQGVAER